ncbi:hypothetical protein BXY85_1678 [Roseivirga pacifica]|uniref:Uncharacterized protein n=1 Tax=Roseivirga pacifica TaxID=1267423 RepID=A0A1I0MS98_9BACT|nr:hypothetical protein [Roseivirga pacifica]RKQ50661.1 hypothetical protein BXY85_1678 [Roseivirga pacifica]SEV91581.1 hypothetical protein SAMN05216290_0661 [Roseivirga pacifica]
MEITKPPVLDFNEENLIKAIMECNPLQSEIKLKSSFTFRYLIKYFDYQYQGGNGNQDHCKAKTIVIEKNYVSESYLEDFKFYSSTSFRNISKFSSRIHFFHSPFNQSDFVSNAIGGIKENKGEEIWSGYLGYVTVRPLGVSPFGVCLVKPYPYIENVRRRYINSVIPNLRLDVFGRQINLPSLAFQQQDKTVGVCATFAIWSAYHKLAHLFKTKLPSPYQISQMAGTSLSNPNTSMIEGFDAVQITSVLQNSDISSLVFTLNNQEISSGELKELIYSYNKSGIPILLGYGNPENILDSHLVTIVGYRIKSKASKRGFIGKTKFVAHDIFRIYSHNDMLGPFSKIDILPQSINGTIKLKTFQISGESSTISTAMNMWIPLEKSIRVSYYRIKLAVEKIEALIVKKQFLSSLKSIQWDIALLRAVNYKQEYASISTDDQRFINLKQKIRLFSYPKYIWLARMMNGDDVLCDFVYDASALPNDNILLQINCLDEDLMTKIEKARNTIKDKDDHGSFSEYQYENTY